MMIPSVLPRAPLYKMVVDRGLVDSLAGVIVPIMVSTYAGGVVLLPSERSSSAV